MMKAYFKPYELIFKRPAGTSRGVLNTKLTYFLYVEKQNLKIVGECAFFRGLSVDDEKSYENKLQWVCDNIEKGETYLLENTIEYPSIQIGIEQIFKQLETGIEGLFCDNDFYKGERGVGINGLIWMGGIDFMKEQIQTKLQQNYSCIKLKIGVNWEEEIKVVEELRKEYTKDILELRVDANGAFSFEEAEIVLQQLYDLGIHSIEQPIKQGQEEQMAILCANTPISIALDEELIGKFYKEDKIKLLEKIKPQYIILKPSLVGGIRGSEEWIKIAKSLNIGWWVTSALESNIGLNAISQWVSTLDTSMVQGLGTGSLYENNTPSNLEIVEDKLYLNKK